MKKNSLYAILVCTLGIFAACKGGDATNDTEATEVDFLLADESTTPDGYLDLGLPSKTVWKIENETDFLNYNDAMATYGDKMPTAKQWNELMECCKWEWTDIIHIVICRNRLA